MKTLSLVIAISLLALIALTNAAPVESEVTEENKSPEIKNDDDKDDNSSEIKTDTEPDTVIEEKTGDLEADKSSIILDDDKIFKRSPDKENTEESVADDNISKAANEAESKESEEKTTVGDLSINQPPNQNAEVDKEVDTNISESEKEGVSQPSNIVRDGMAVDKNEDAEKTLENDSSEKLDTVNKHGGASDQLLDYSSTFDPTESSRRTLAVIETKGRSDDDSSEAAEIGRSGIPLIPSSLAVFNDFGSKKIFREDLIVPHVQPSIGNVFNSPVPPLANPALMQTFRSDAFPLENMKEIERFNLLERTSNAYPYKPLQPQPVATSQKPPTFNLQAKPFETQQFPSNFYQHFDPNQYAQNLDSFSYPRDRRFTVPNVSIIKKNLGYRSPYYVK